MSILYITVMDKGALRYHTFDPRKDDKEWTISQALKEFDIDMPSTQKVSWVTSKLFDPSVHTSAKQTDVIPLGRSCVFVKIT